VSKETKDQVLDALLKERNDALARVVKRVKASKNVEKGNAQHSSHSSAARRTHAAHVTPRDVSSEAVIRATVTRLVEGLAPVDKAHSRSLGIQKRDDLSTSGLDPRESSAYKGHVSEFILAPKERRKRIQSILEELSEEERRGLLVLLIERELGSEC